MSAGKSSDLSAKLVDDPTERCTATEVLAGLVERITFHNQENGFCVLRVKGKRRSSTTTLLI